MEAALWPIFIVNIGINSLLSFFTLNLLMIFALKILYIKNPRIQAYCLLIPFMKLVLDLTYYQFSHWALAQQLDPLKSPEGTRILSVNFWLDPFHYPLSSIDFHLKEGQTFTLADLLCLQMGSQWTMVIAFILTCGSILFCGYAIWQSLLSRQWLKELCSTSISYSGPFQDPFLQSKMQKKKIVLYLTHMSHSPFITGYRHSVIFISQSLFEKLTTEEFEAIIAHEIAHLQHGDLVINTVLFWICHLFWWIPTHYFKKKLELAQEYACDRIINTHLHYLNLAKALYQTANWLHQTPLPSFARPFANSHHTVKRLQALLIEPQQRESPLLKWIKMLFLITWILTLSFGKFWIF